MTGETRADQSLVLSASSLHLSPGTRGSGREDRRWRGGHVAMLSEHCSHHEMRRETTRGGCVPHEANVS